MEERLTMSTNKTGFEAWFEAQQKYAVPEADYVRAKRHSFMDHVEGELRAYLNRLPADEWNMEEFFQDAIILWEFPEYEEWMEEQYELSKDQEDPFNFTEEDKENTKISSVDWSTPY